jgi:hypothetical protein
MANPTASKVVAGKPSVVGGAFYGPTATAGPVDGTTALGVGFTGLGYIGDDGLSETVDRSTDKKKAWGGDVVKIVQTDFGATIKLTLIESLNSDVLKAVYGDGNVSTTAATATEGTEHKVQVNSDILPMKSWVFEIRDDPAKIRIYVESGQVTEIGEVKYTESDLTGYEITIECFPDADGNAFVKYINDGVTVP